MNTRISALFLLLASFSSVTVADLLLYGGKDYEEFLGCLSCGKYDKQSICNKFEDYGSVFSAKSIWNKDGKFGYKYNKESPWNKFSTNPPKVMDENGRFYGFFAANKYQKDRTANIRYAALLNDADNAYKDLEKARDQFCK